MSNLIGHLEDRFSHGAAQYFDPSDEHYIHEYDVSHFSHEIQRMGMRTKQISNASQRNNAM